MPESIFTPAPSDDLNLTPVPEVNLVIEQDPMAGTNNNQPPINLTMVAVPDFQNITDSFSRFVGHARKAIRDRDIVIDQLKKGLKNRVSVGTMANDPRRSSKTINAPLDTNPLETLLRSTELRDDKKRIEEQDAVSEKDKHTILEMQATIRKLQATIEERDKTIQELQDMWKEVRQNWQKAEDSLQKANQNPSSDFTSSRDIDDNSVRKKLNTLSTRIEEVAKSYFSGSPMTANARAEIKVLFDRITPDWVNGYLRDDKHRKRRKRYFIEAVIWHKLIDTFLKHPLIILSKGMGTSLYDLHSKLWLSRPRNAEKLQSYHSTRLQMAELHLQIQGKNGRYLGKRQMAMEGRAKLVADLEAILSNYTNEICECQTELQSIVELAVELAYSMAMAKANYAVRMGAALHTNEFHGFAFRSGSMESIAAPVPGDDVVELVVSPALVKSGTSEGVDYEKSLNILEKARVFCEGYTGAESDTE
ncbi:hypothetical protein PG995_003266 [Apiospora arundinis]